MTPGDPVVVESRSGPPTRSVPPVAEPLVADPLVAEPDAGGN